MKVYHCDACRKDRNYYISEGMLLAYDIVADYLDDLEVIT